MTKFNTTPLPEASKLKQTGRTRYPQFDNGAYLDVLKLVRVVRLEWTDHSILAGVDAVAILDDRYLILDAGQSTLFMFGEDGRFIQRVGKLGEGPGEYIEPSSISTVDGNFVVFDQTKRSFITYSKEGAWVKTAPFKTHRVFPSNGVLTAGDKYYLPAPNYTLSRNEHLPIHLICDAETGEVQYGFEKRFAPFLRSDKIFRQAYRTMAIVGNRVWSGPPHMSEIYVHDLEGRFVQKLVPGLSDGLDVTDWEGATGITRFLAIAKSKSANKRIISTPTTAFAFYTGYHLQKTYEKLSVFDTEGNLLAKNISTANVALFSKLIATQGEQLVGVSAVDFFSLKYIHKALSEEHVKLFEDAGWVKERGGDASDNPYLVFFAHAFH